MPSDALSGAARRFTVAVPRTVRRGRPIPVTVRSSAPFSVRLAVTARVRGQRRSVVRRPTRRLGAGRWTWRLRVPRRHARRGRTVQVTVIAGLDGRRLVERRTIRFR